MVTLTTPKKVTLPDGKLFMQNAKEFAEMQKECRNNSVAIKITYRKRMAIKNFPDLCQKDVSRIKN